MILRVKIQLLGLKNSSVTDQIERTISLDGGANKKTILRKIAKAIDTLNTEVKLIESIKL